MFTLTRCFFFLYNLIATAAEWTANTAIVYRHTDQRQWQRRKQLTVTYLTLHKLRLLSGELNSLSCLEESNDLKDRSLSLSLSLYMPTSDHVVISAICNARCLFPYSTSASVWNVDERKMEVSGAISWNRSVRKILLALSSQSIKIYSFQER